MRQARENIQARNPKPEQLFVKPEARKLLPGDHSRQPGKFPWCVARKPEQIFGLYPDLQAARTRTRTFFAAHLEHSTQKRPSPKARPRKTRTFCTKPQEQARSPTSKVPAYPPKRCYMPDYAFIYYLLLYPPHH